MKKVLLVCSYLMLTCGLTVYCQNITNVPAPKKNTIDMTGWSTSYDINDKNWVVWGLNSPVLEKREIRSDENKDGTRFTYHWGSFYLCENSIIIMIKYKTFYEPELVHFLFDYGWDPKKGENCYRKVKDAAFHYYGNNASYAYSNDEDLVNWVKAELKNKTSEIAPIQVMISENNGFGYYYPMITYDLYPYSEKEITNTKKALFSRPEDKRVTETERLDVYPTPINSNKTIKDYIDWKLTSNQGFHCPQEYVRANINFVIEADGTVSNLIFDDRGECYVMRRNYQQCLVVNDELKGFNSWAASIINSMTFNPGKLNGTPVRTFCKLEINYKNNSIRKFRGINIVYNGEKYGIANEEGRMNYDYIFDDVIVLDDTDLEVIINGKHGILQDVHAKEPYQRKLLIPAQYDSITKIHKKNESFNLIFYLATKDGKKTIFDDNGKEQFSLDNTIDVSLYDLYFELWESENVVSKKHGIITKNGKVVLPCEFEKIMFFNSKRIEQKDMELFIVKKEGKFGIIRWDAYRDLDEIEAGINSSQFIHAPKMWFDDIDLKHNSLNKYDINNRLNYTFWVKIDGREDWGLVRINKSGSVDVLLKPEFDNVIGYNEVSKGNKTYQITIDEKERANKKRIRK